MQKTPIVIIGAGPAGLMAAQKLAEQGFIVHVYEKNKAAARKFLVAGHGGFNLTHSENLELFIKKYNKQEIENVVKFFDNNDTVNWLKELGITCFTGSSGKIFPTKEHKPIHVLQAWLHKLEKLGVKILYNHKFLDFNKETVLIEHQNKTLEIQYNTLILSLGGASWAKTGSDGSWSTLLKNKGITINNFEPANSGLNTALDLKNLEGQVIKNIQITFDNIEKKGEIVFTHYGIEGSPIYFLNRYLRNHNFPIDIFIDLKPNLSLAEVESLLSINNKITDVLKNKLKLSKAAILLLKTLDKACFTNPKTLSINIKKFVIKTTGFRPIDEVISTAGGLALEELTADFALKNFPNIYCIGEMLDWDAPTGGYLLQACFSSGAYVASKIKIQNQS